MDHPPLQSGTGPQAEEQAGGGVPQRGDFQDQVGRGHRHPHHGRLHRVLRQVGGKAGS